MVLLFIVLWSMIKYAVKLFPSAINIEFPLRPLHEFRVITGPPGFSVMSLIRDRLKTLNR